MVLDYRTRDPKYIDVASLAGDSVLTVDRQDSFVGIGNADPQAPLHVSGSARVDGNIDITGQILRNGEIFKAEVAEKAFTYVGSDAFPSQGGTLALDVQATQNVVVHLGPTASGGSNAVELEITGTELAPVLPDGVVSADGASAANAAATASSVDPDPAVESGAALAFNRQLDPMAGPGWSSAPGKYDTDGTYLGSSQLGGVAGEWLQVSLELAVPVAAVEITQSKGRCAPRSFVVLGSDDGVRWTSLFEVANETRWVRPWPPTAEEQPETLRFDVADAELARTAYRHFAVVVREVNNPGEDPLSTQAQIQELVLLEHQIPAASIGKRYTFVFVERSHAPRRVHFDRRLRFVRGGARPEHITHAPVGQAFAVDTLDMTIVDRRSVLAEYRHAFLSSELPGAAAAAPGSGGAAEGSRDWVTAAIDTTADVSKYMVVRPNSDATAFGSEIRNGRSGGGSAAHQMLLPQYANLGGMTLDSTTSSERYDMHNFGSCTKMSHDGKVVVISAVNAYDPVTHYHRAGRAWLYIRPDEDAQPQLVGELRPKDDAWRDSYQQFGLSVSINHDGSVVAVSCPRRDIVPGASHNNGDDNRGVVYIFECENPTTSSKIEDWVNTHTILNPEEENTGFGGYAWQWMTGQDAIAINREGDRLVVGAPLYGTNDDGALYVYDRVGPNEWTLFQRLTSGYSGYRGYAVAISADSTTIVQGSPNYSSGYGGIGVYRNTQGTETSRSSSYTNVSNRYYSDYITQGFSLGVSHDGGTIVAGAPGYYSEHTSTSGYWPRVVVWYETSRNSYSNTFWYGTNHSTYYGNARNYGCSVSINQAGTCIAVGYPRSYDNISTSGGSFTGGVEIFRGSRSSWSMVAKLTTEYSSSTLSDSFGRSLCLSSSGGSLIVGNPAYYSNGTYGMTTNHTKYGIGSADAFKVSNKETFQGWTNVWSPIGWSVPLLTADVLYHGNSQYNAMYSSDDFGYRVVVSGDGMTAVVTQPTAIGDDVDNGGTTNRGVLRIFCRTPTDSEWRLVQSITYPSNSSGYLGTDVAISHDATVIAAAAYNTHEVFLYKNASPGTAHGGITGSARVSSSKWTQQSSLYVPSYDSSAIYPRCISMNGDGTVLAIGSTSFDFGGENNRGIAYLVNISNPTSPSLVKKFTSTNTSQGGAQFGSSVVLSRDGSLLFVGARYDDDRATDAGAIYVFTKDASSGAWDPIPEAKLTATYNGSGMYAGNDTDYSSGKSVITNSDGSLLAFAIVPYASSRGRVYVYARDAATKTWSVRQEIYRGGDTSDNFGRAMAADDDFNTILIGAYAVEATPIDRLYTGNSNQGRVFKYSRQGTIWVETKSYEIPRNRSSTGYFGNAIGCSATASTIVITARNANVTGVTTFGAAWVYHEDQNSAAIYSLGDGIDRTGASDVSTQGSQVVPVYNDDGSVRLSIELASAAQVTVERVVFKGAFAYILTRHGGDIILGRDGAAEDSRTTVRMLGTKCASVIKVDAATGALVWSSQLAVRDGDTDASQMCVKDNGRVYVSGTYSSMLGMSMREAGSPAENDDVLPATEGQKTFLVAIEADGSFGTSTFLGHEARNNNRVVRFMETNGVTVYLGMEITEAGDRIQPWSSTTPVSPEDVTDASRFYQSPASHTAAANAEVILVAYHDSLEYENDASRRGLVYAWHAYQRMYQGVPDTSAASADSAVRFMGLLASSTDAVYTVTSYLENTYDDAVLRVADSTDRAPYTKAFQGVKGARRAVLAKYSTSNGRLVWMSDMFVWDNGSTLGSVDPSVVEGNCLAAFGETDLLLNVHFRGKGSLYYINPKRTRFVVTSNMETKATFAAVVVTPTGEARWCLKADTADETSDVAGSATRLADGAVVVAASTVDSDTAGLRVHDAHGTVFRLDHRAIRMVRFPPSGAFNADTQVPGEWWSHASFDVSGKDLAEVSFDDISEMFRDAIERNVRTIVYNGGSSYTYRTAIEDGSAGATAPARTGYHATRTVFMMGPIPLWARPDEWSKYTVREVVVY